MTQEEKAKRYDEAIKKAKSKIKNDKDHIIYEDDVIEIFPELIESEDERIRKELGKYKVKYTQEVLEKHLNSMSNKDDERLRKTTIAFLKEFAEQGYENAVECIDWLKSLKQRIGE